MCYLLGVTLGVLGVLITERNAGGFRCVNY